MAATPATSAILDALNPTRASARERQGETERRIREEARRLAAEGGVVGELAWHPIFPSTLCLALTI